jgi:hypothetical protein
MAEDIIPPVTEDIIPGDPALRIGEDITGTRIAMTDMERTRAVGEDTKMCCGWAILFFLISG